MLFNTLPFLWLLLGTFILYYIPRLSKLQIQILIAASLLFYAYAHPKLVFLLLFTAGINIITSYFVAYGDQTKRKLTATIGVVSNLLILIFFKYGPLISDLFFSPTDSVGEFLLRIPLPVGISFFTFQGISLMVDTYKENYYKSKDLIPKSFGMHTKNTLFFMIFFPQLVAGPVVKAHDFLPQIRVKRFKDIAWLEVFKHLTVGYFLKMVIADNLKDFTYWIMYPYFLEQTGIDLIALLVGYTCQLFADFAGYSLIAIGLAKLFGYRLKKNFNFPFISASFKELWKRWHISLSSFLQEYLYIPLGGSRKGKVRTYFNLFITMALGGLWHGAGLNFIAWGVYNGLLLMIERMIEDKIKIKQTGVIIFFRRIMVFSLYALSFTTFTLSKLSHIIEYIKIMFTGWSLSFDRQLCINILIYCIPVFVYHTLYLLKDKKAFGMIRRHEYIAYGLLLFFILTNSGSPGAFIYFQF